MSVADIELLNRETNPIKFIEFIGSGAFGETYLAQVVEKDLLRRCDECEYVAVKIPKNPHDRSKADRFLDESAKLIQTTNLRQKGQENVIRYFKAVLLNYPDSRIVGLLMEYAPSGDLRSLLGPLHASKRLPTGRAVEITIGILKGLEYIHKQEMLHLDIKPENILMNGNTPKVADLGTSRLIGQTNQSIVIGTLFYNAPEKFAIPQVLSETTDLWSVGVMLYEMLGGRLPFGFGYNSHQEMMIFEDILKKNPPSLRQLAPDLPAELTGITEFILQKDPARRYPRAHNAQIALSAFYKKYMADLNERIRRLKSDAARSPRFEPETAEALRKAVEQYPTEPDLITPAIQYLNRHKQVETMLALCRKACEATFDPTIQYYCGLAFHSNRETDSARSCFQSPAMRHLPRKQQAQIEQMLNHMERQTDAL
jgi:serine/threonine protein kinase